MVTDHHSLCWLTSLKDLTGRLGRWALELQEYDFPIVYKSGRKHQGADALSRCPLPLNTTAVPPDTNTTASIALISRETFLYEQRADPWINQIISHLNGTNPSNNQRFLIKLNNFLLLTECCFAEIMIHKVSVGFLSSLNTSDKKYYSIYTMTLLPAI